jgi:alkylation response protein AidB-like acyl-CoA dehydrogenase
MSKPNGDVIMSATAVKAGSVRTPIEIARELGPVFAERARATADEDRYVAENMALLKTSGLVEAGVPRELGGGGADADELAAMLRELAKHCASTALAFSMHTHQVAVPAWRWKHQKVAAVEPLLKRIAGERILMLSSGGSDWIAGSGKAEKVDGGYRIRARKVFASGAPTGDLLMTSAVLEPEDGSGPTVLHFGVPMSSPQVKIIETWRTLGMRATGSHDIQIDGHVVPEAGVALKRKSGEWHPLFQIISTIAFPLVYAVYLGVAENARDIATGLVKRKGVGSHTLEQIGRMETELAGARLAHESMMAAVRLNAPSADTINQVMIGKRLLTSHAIATVEHAMEAAGGAGFYRAAGLERRFRDIQAARYHPLHNGPQEEFAGAMALGMPTERIF